MRGAILLLAFCALFLGAAAAASPRSVYLEDLTGLKCGMA